jgi:hypothetical protein
MIECVASLFALSNRAVPVSVYLPFRQSTRKPGSRTDRVFDLFESRLLSTGPVEYRLESRTVLCTTPIRIGDDTPAAPAIETPGSKNLNYKSVDQTTRLAKK